MLVLFDGWTSFFATGFEPLAHRTCTSGTRMRRSSRSHPALVHRQEPALVHRTSSERRRPARSGRTWMLARSSGLLGPRTSEPAEDRPVPADRASPGKTTEEKLLQRGSLHAGADSSVQADVGVLYDAFHANEKFCRVRGSGDGAQHPEIQSSWRLPEILLDPHLPQAPATYRRCLPVSHPSGA
jgi:hypothetical protein